jgi:hypothetical protein
MWRVGLAMAVGCAAPCFGWGEEGQRLVVAIAGGLMTTAAKARVAASLMPGEALETIVYGLLPVAPAGQAGSPFKAVNVAQPCMTPGIETNLLRAKLKAPRDVEPLP